VRRNNSGEEPTGKHVMRFAGTFGLLLVLIFGALFCIWRPYSVPGPMMRDFEAYYAAGATWAAGGDPYSTQIWNVEKTIPGVDAGRLEVLPFLGPPISLPLWAFFARFPFDVATKLWGVLLALAVIVIFAGSFALAGRRMRWSDAPIVVALAAAFSPLSNGFSLGQTAPVATAAMIAALWLLRSGRWPWSGIGSFAALFLKPNVSLALVGMLRSRSGFLSVATASIAFAAGNILLGGGPAGIIRYLQALHAHTLAERWSFIQMTAGSIAFGFGLSGPAAATCGMLVAAAAVGTLGVVVYRTRARELEATALACTAIPFVSPFLHVHDLIILFLPAMLCIHRARGRAWAAGAIGTVLIATDWVAMTQGKIGATYDFLVALVIAIEIIALSPAVRAPLRFMPLVVALLIVPMWFLAPTKGIALWPDGLPHSFTVALNQPIAAVWASEQVAAGLERVDPFGAFARLFSLGGCALVWGALAVTLSKRGELPARGDIPLEVAAKVRPVRGQRRVRVATEIDG
jgi:hypothetical protein